MKLSRLYQPRHPAFWCMLVLNGLSAGLAWVLHNRSLNTAGVVLVAVFAIGNGLLGMWMAWRLVRGKAPR
jgi:uncharacterized membrane protein